MNKKKKHTHTEWKYNTIVSIQDRELVKKRMQQQMSTLDTQTGIMVREKDMFHVLCAHATVFR